MHNLKEVLPHFLVIELCHSIVEGVCCVWNGEEREGQSGGQVVMEEGPGGSR